MCSGPCQALSKCLTSGCITTKNRCFTLPLFLPLLLSPKLLSVLALQGPSLALGTQIYFCPLTAMAVEDVLKSNVSRLQALIPS